MFTFENKYKKNLDLNVQYFVTRVVFLHLVFRN